MNGHFCVYECMYICMYVHHVCGALGGHKRVLGPLELELQVVMSCLMWVSEPRSSTRTENTLNC